MNKLKPGDPVAYRTKDIHGYQWICATVHGTPAPPGHTNILMQPGCTHIQIPTRVLTKIKTVWNDTKKVC